MYRRDVPSVLIEAAVCVAGLTDHDVVVDLGCGTGQVAVPLSQHVASVLAADPEPDMLTLARRAAADQGVTNVTWVLGSDRDLPALGSLTGDHALAAVTLANAIHLTSGEDLFAALRQVLRPGGGLAVIANGTPLWQQPSAWSRALRAGLERWLDTRLESCCGTDAASRQRYQAAMLAAGFTDVHEVSVDYTGDLNFDELIGSVYSAMPLDLLPQPGRRAAFAEHIRGFTGPGPRFTEQVHVAALIGRSI